MSEASKTLVCTCRQAGILDAQAVQEALRERTNAGAGCLVVEDLCALAAGEPGNLREAMAGVEHVVACHPRAIRWLLARGKIDTKNLRFTDARAEAKAAGKGQPLDGWAAWYPVIDYDRCSGCGQCLEFCLFDVYERGADGTVAAARPRQCKTNCPACARICPETAILFPKYGTAPYNGAEVPEGFVGGADVPARLGGDPYAALRAREGGRFSTKEAGSAGGALPRDLAAALDIPAELMASADAGALREKLSGRCPCEGGPEEDDEEERCPCEGGR